MTRYSTEQLAELKAASKGRPFIARLARERHKVESRTGTG